jgi:predicted dithiol-disulfide oxidoreductase (DUF899 family)
MSRPRVVSAAEWLAARKEFQVAEEQAIKALEQVASQRRELPAVRIERTTSSKARTARPACLTCSKAAVSSSCSTSYSIRPARKAARSAPIRPTASVIWPTCTPTTPPTPRYSGHRSARSSRSGSGWAGRSPWYSSLGSDFNYDFHVIHDESVAPVEWNYRTVQELIDRGEPYFARPSEQGGVSVFLLDGDVVLHTWSGYGPVTSVLSSTDMLLDLTPLGRQDESVELLHHDRYPVSGGQP